jgi:predicted RNA-binding protein with RPS1 domain
MHTVDPFLVLTTAEEINNKEGFVHLTEIHKEYIRLINDVLFEQEP